MTLEDWAKRRTCACPHPDAYECARLRDPSYMEDRYCIDQPCECPCHDDWMLQDEDYDE